MIKLAREREGERESESGVSKEMKRKNKVGNKGHRKWVFFRERGKV